MALVTDGKGRKWRGYSCTLPLAQAHLDPVWILTLPKPDFSVKGESRVRAKVIMFFSCVGRGQHGLAMHQVSGTLEGRKRHGGCLGSEGVRVKPSSRGPRPLPNPTSTESPPHPWGVMRAHFIEDAIEAHRGEEVCPSSHTGVSI